MATRVYLRSATSSGHSFGGLSQRLIGGSDVAWGKLDAATAKGAGVVGNTVTTVAGPTAGLEITANGTNPLHFFTPPLDREVTISGTITFNIWGIESNASANATFRVQVDALAGAGAIIDSTHGTEIATSTSVHNWTAVPAGTLVPKGTRLRIRISADDATALTMGAGFVVTLRAGGTTDAADGDSYIEFTEDFGFQTLAVPGGDVLYLRDTAFGFNPTSNTERLLDPSRGSSAVERSNTGFDSYFYKDLGHDWYTPAATYDIPLQGLIALNLRSYYTRAFSSDFSYWGINVYICDGDGTNEVRWDNSGQCANNGSGVNLTTEVAYPTIYVAGPDATILTGQRLRFRFRLAPNDLNPNASTSTTRIVYDGATPGGSGDSYITLPFSFTQPITNERKFRRSPVPLRWR